MKMDIEGSETKALMGAARLLVNYPPCTILFEHQPAATTSTGVAPTLIFEILTQAGYTVYQQARKLSAPEWGAWDLIAQHENEYE